MFLHERNETTKGGEYSVFTKQEVIDHRITPIAARLEQVLQLSALAQQEHAALKNQIESLREDLLALRARLAAGTQEANTELNAQLASTAWQNAQAQRHPQEGDRTTLVARRGAIRQCFGEINKTVLGQTDEHGSVGYALYDALALLGELHPANATVDPDSIPDGLSGGDYLDIGRNPMAVSPCIEAQNSEAQQLEPYIVLPDGKLALITTAIEEFAKLRSGSEASEFSSFNEVQRRFVQCAIDKKASGVIGHTVQEIATALLNPQTIQNAARPALTNLDALLTQDYVGGISKNVILTALQPRLSTNATPQRQPNEADEAYCQRLAQSGDPTLDNAITTRCVATDINRTNLNPRQTQPGAGANDQTNQSQNRYSAQELGQKPSLVTALRLYNQLQRVVTLLETAHNNLQNSNPEKAAVNELKDKLKAIAEKLIDDAEDDYKDELLPQSRIAAVLGDTTIDELRVSATTRLEQAQAGSSSNGAAISLTRAAYLVLDFLGQLQPKNTYTFDSSKFSRPSVPTAMRGDGIVANPHDSRFITLPDGRVCDISYEGRNSSGTLHGLINVLTAHVGADVIEGREHPVDTFAALTIPGTDALNLTVREIEQLVLTAREKLAAQRVPIIRELSKVKQLLEVTGLRLLIGATNSASPASGASQSEEKPITEILDELVAALTGSKSLTSAQLEFVTGIRTKLLGKLKQTGDGAAPEQVKEKVYEALVALSLAYPNTRIDIVSREKLFVDTPGAIVLSNGYIVKVVEFIKANQIDYYGPNRESQAPGQLSEEETTKARYEQKNPLANPADRQILHAMDVARILEQAYALGIPALDMSNICTEVTKYPGGDSTYVKKYADLTQAGGVLRDYQSKLAGIERALTGLESQLAASLSQNQEVQQALTEAQTKKTALQQKISALQTAVHEYRTLLDAQPRPADFAAQLAAKKQAIETAKTQCQTALSVVEAAVRQAQQVISAQTPPNNSDRQRSVRLPSQLSFTAPNTVRRLKHFCEASQHRDGSEWKLIEEPNTSRPHGERKTIVEVKRVVRDSAGNVVTGSDGRPRTRTNKLTCQSNDIYPSDQSLAGYKDALQLASASGLQPGEKVEILNPEKIQSSVLKDLIRHVLGLDQVGTSPGYYIPNLETILNMPNNRALRTELDQAVAALGDSSITTVTAFNNDLRNSVTDNRYSAFYHGGGSQSQSQQQQQQSQPEP